MNEEIEQEEEVLTVEQQLSQELAWRTLERDRLQGILKFNPPQCLQCQAYEREISVLNNLNLKLAVRNDKLESMRDALRQASIGELCGIECSDPVDLTGLEERE